MGIFVRTIGLQRATINLFHANRAHNIKETIESVKSFGPVETIGSISVYTLRKSI